MDEGVLEKWNRRISALEHVETMMCDEEDVAQAGPDPVHQVRHGVPPGAAHHQVYHGQPPVSSTASADCSHRVVESRMEMDEEAAAMTSWGARATAPRPRGNGRFSLAEEFPHIKSVSQPPSPKMDATPSEHSAVGGRLAQLEREKQTLLGQAVVAK